MRLAVVIDVWQPLWGGVQVHILGLARRLVRDYGCQVDIHTINFSAEDNGEYPEVESYESGRLRLIRAGKPRRFSYLGRLAWTWDVIRSVKACHRASPYHLIHAHGYLPGLPGKALSKVLGIPVVFTVHGSNLLDLNQKSPLFLVEYFLLTKIKYDLMISVSWSFLKHPNVNEVVVIPNGVDLAEFHRVSQESRQSEAKPFFKMLYVGRLHRLKGLDLLFKALAGAKELMRERPAKLYLVGDGPEEGSLRTLAQRLAIADLVVFTGKLSGERLLKEYLSADLFVLPSLSEGQPLTLLEAGAARLPVIATAVGDNHLLVQDQVNGYLIPPGDLTALREKMVQALKNEGLKELGEAGYRLVKENYSLDETARQTYAAYQRVVA
ncbi:MAG: glycosyltransferase family 4 protein [Thermodesulfobacteriota bacterium]